jgi:hypothetical protein
LPASIPPTTKGLASFDNLLNPNVRKQPKKGNLKIPAFRQCFQNKVLHFHGISYGNHYRKATKSINTKTFDVRNYLSFRCLFYFFMLANSLIWRIYIAQEAAKRTFQVRLNTRTEENSTRAYRLLEHPGSWPRAFRNARIQHTEIRRAMDV